MATSTTEARTDGDTEVQLIVLDASPPSDEGIAAVSIASVSEEDSPLLIRQNDRPKINIFSRSYSRRKPREQVIKVIEPDTSPVTQFMLYIWNGSRYSGLLCMTLSSTIYFLMEVVSSTLAVQSIPLFETTFIRCVVILSLSYLWLRRSGQPIFGPAHARKLLVSRALVGCLSLFGFIYSIQMLPLSQAIILSFTTPIMASIAARLILQEKLKIMDIGGLACSFLGLLFIFTTQAVELEAIARNYEGIYHVYAVLIGLFSSITGGISYCLIKAGAKASDQPVITVFSFGLISSPAAAICMFTIEKIVLPGFSSLVAMAILAALAFSAEVFLARALQLEKTSKVANIQYITAVFTRLWVFSASGIAPSFGPMLGCLLILISVSSTIYLGPDKETEQ